MPILCSCSAYVCKPASRLTSKDIKKFKGTSIGPLVSSMIAKAVLQRLDDIAMNGYKSNFGRKIVITCSLSLNVWGWRLFNKSRTVSSQTYKSLWRKRMRMSWSVATETENERPDSARKQIARLHSAFRKQPSDAAQIYAVAQHWVTKLTHTVAP